MNVAEAIRKAEVEAQKLKITSERLQKKRWVGQAGLVGVIGVGGVGEAGRGDGRGPAVGTGLGAGVTSTPK